MTELTKKCKQKPPTNVLAKVFHWDDVEFCENDVTAVVFSLFPSNLMLNNLYLFNGYASQKSACLMKDTVLTSVGGLEEIYSYRRQL